MKIEKNIPVSKRFPWGKYYSLVAEMESGDSVLCKDRKESRLIRESITNNCKGYKPVQRTQEDGTIRIWKVKKEDKTDE